jgi:ankyrin repeat protein
MSLDPFDNTPLHLSVSNEDYILTLILLRKGANPNIPNKV